MHDTKVQSKKEQVREIEGNKDKSKLCVTQNRIDLHITALSHTYTHERFAIVYRGISSVNR